MKHSHEAPSAWVTRFSGLIAKGGTVLDLACGSGRNTLWLAGQGLHVVAVDRDAHLIATMTGIPGISAIEADLEGQAWPFAERRFDGIIVCRYLHRPLLPILADSLNEGGILIYETFMSGQENLGHPRNPDFLLHPDELLHAYAEKLDVIAFEQGLISEPRPAFLQRICARR